MHVLLKHSLSFWSTSSTVFAAYSGPIVLSGGCPGLCSDAQGKDCRRGVRSLLLGEELGDGLTSEDI